MTVLLRVRHPDSVHTLDVYYTHEDIESARVGAGDGRSDVQARMAMLAVEAMAAISALDSRTGFGEDGEKALHEAALGFALAVERATGGLPSTIDVLVTSGGNARILWMCECWMAARRTGGT